MPFTKTFLSYFLLSGICLNSLQRKIHLFIYLCYSNFAFNFTEIFSKILQTFILQSLENIIKIEIDENTENKELAVGWLWQQLMSLITQNIFKHYSKCLFQSMSWPFISYSHRQLKFPSTSAYQLRNLTYH